MSPEVPCKSKGQHRFSILVFIGCSGGCNSGLGWASGLYWGLLILSWMTSLTWGMLKSVRGVWFVTYRGAFVMAMRILDWDLCMMIMLDLLVQPDKETKLRSCGHFYCSILWRHVCTSLVGLGLLFLEVSISHSDTPHSVGLLWANDRPIAETSTVNLKTLTGDRHILSPGGIRNRNPSNRVAADQQLKAAWPPASADKVQGAVCNGGAGWRKECCRGKAIRVKRSECACRHSTSRIWHAKSMCLIILSIW